MHWLQLLAGAMQGISREPLINYGIFLRDLKRAATKRASQ
jgi:hypothetical protein